MPSRNCATLIRRTPSCGRPTFTSGHRWTSLAATYQWQDAPTRVAPGGACPPSRARAGVKIVPVCSKVTADNHGACRSRPTHTPAEGPGERTAAVAQHDRESETIRWSLQPADRRDPGDARVRRLSWPPSVSELAAAAVDGPIVIVNVSVYGSGLARYKSAARTRHRSGRRPSTVPPRSSQRVLPPSLTVVRSRRSVHGRTTDGNGVICAGRIPGLPTRLRGRTRRCTA